MWGWMKVREILRFMAAFYPTWDWELTRQLLEKFALPSEGKVKHLSKGQNVRLGLLLALAHRPRVVVLDDPALGLDPIMRKEFLRDVVEHLQGGDVTVFFSSHLLYEVEPVADVVGILDGGKMVAEAGTEELRARRVSAVEGGGGRVAGVWGTGAGGAGCEAGWRACGGGGVGCGGGARGDGWGDCGGDGVESG